jgi:hypothetical protein
MEQVTSRFPENHQSSPQAPGPAIGQIWSRDIARRPVVSCVQHLESSLPHAGAQA